MMKTIFLRAVLMASAIALSACSGSGGGSSPPAPIPTPITTSYPSATKSTYSANPAIVKAGVPTVVTVVVKDQHSRAFALGTKWDLQVQVTCAECFEDPSVSYIGTSNGNPQYRFTSTETKAHSFVVLFSPKSSYSTFDRDFPNGIDPDELYALAMTVPRYDVCDNSPSATYHGLRGVETVANKERYALCNPADLKLAAESECFFDKDLFLAKDIDLSSYYTAGNPEFSFASCDDCMFSGSLYGNYKSITGFKRTNGLGLFNLLVGGRVDYLKLINTNQSGAETGGSIAAVMGQYASVTGVEVSGSVTGSRVVGGIVGEMYDSYIIASKSSASVTSSYRAGGLAGLSSMDNGAGYNQISASSSTGTVKTKQTTSGDVAIAGGLIAASDWNTRIYNSYVRGTIESAQVAGGLAGIMHGSIDNSYVYADIVAPTAAGLAAEFDVNTNVNRGTDPSGNLVRKSFVNATTTAQEYRAVAIICGNLSVQTYFANGAASECAIENGYSPSMVTRGTPATVANLMSMVQNIVSQWDVTVWNLSPSSLPQNR